LNLEFDANQVIQVHAFGDHVASQEGGRFVSHAECQAHLIEYFRGEECDLSLVVFLEIEKAVAADAAPGQAFEFGNLDDRVPAGRPAMMPEIVVAGLNV
jgi:hypothetical protein